MTELDYFPFLPFNIQIVYNIKIFMEIISIYFLPLDTDCAGVFGPKGLPRAPPAAGLSQGPPLFRPALGSPHAPRNPHSLPAPG